MPSISTDILHVRAADGADLPVHRWRPAEGTGPAVVAIHGAGSHGAWFATFGEALARRGVTLYVPDRRGSGLARGLAEPDSPEVWIDDLRRVLAALTALGAPVTVAPWCFGAKLAIPALEGTAGIDRILLLAPAFGFHPEGAARLKAGIESGPEFPYPVPLEDFADSEHARAFIDADPLRWLTMTRHFAAMSRALFARTREVLPTLRQPVVAVFAARDLLVDNEGGRAMVAALGHECRTIDASHTFFLDDPEGSADLLVSLL